MTKLQNHKKKKGRIGSSFDDFLKEEGIYTEVTARATKRAIAKERAGRAGRKTARGSSGDLPA